MELKKIVDASPLFFQEHQSGIVEKLSKTIHKQETYTPEHLLEITYRVNSIDVSKLPEEVKRTFQTLCGRVHTLNVNQIVDAIFDEAHALSSGDYSSSEELAHRIQTLKEMMADVWDKNSLSRENTNFLQIASKKLARLAPQTLSSKIDDMVHLPQINFIEDEEMLPESKIIRAVVSSEWETAELSIEILQVAQLLHQKHPEGVVKFRQLPQDVQEKLGAADHSSKYIQKMVTMSMQMVRSDGYVPSQKEIELMFLEAPSET